MQNKTQGRGYTLLEIMIVLAVLAGAVVGVLRLFAMGSVKAATQREQTSISALVDAVRGVYASSPSYAGIAMTTVEQQARLDQVLRANGTPVSAFGGTLTLAAATVRAPDDAFSIRISQLSTKACAALVPALAGQTAQVSTTSGGNIQQQPHRVPDAAAIATACAGAFFQKNQGALTLVYYSPRATGAAAHPGPACAASCAPQTQTQTLTCPTGQVGQINQTRSGTCSAGACPSQVWSPWTTVSSSCAVAPAPPLPIVPIAPTDPGSACVPRVETRSIPCPVGQVGNRTQQQTITCDAGGAHLGAWTTTYDTCLAPPLPCQGGVLTGADTCPAGEFGQVSWVKEMTCTGGGLMIGPKVLTGSSCATIGTCRPSSRPGPTKTEACPAGQSGQVTQQTTEYSTCAGATAVPIWGPAQVTSTSNTCANNVPGPVTNFEIGFWGGYWWNQIKTGWGTCNAPADGTNPSAGGSTGYNSWVLLNTDDASAAITDHYVITMTRHGITKTVIVPAHKITKNATLGATQPDGRQYWYQSWAGIFDVATVNALTPDIDWSTFAYKSATANEGGGITITPEYCAASVSITACNAAGQCSAPTTETDGISVFSEGERTCQAMETGSSMPYPATARQCTKKPALSGCGDPCAAHGGSAGWFTGRWMSPGKPECVMALPYCEPGT